MLPLRKYPFLLVADGVDWKNVNPALLSALNRLGRARGEILRITSGYRSREQQAALYARYKASGFNIKYIAAKPGQSNHESGNAVDVTIGNVPLARAEKASVLAQFGLSSPVKGDPVHTELAAGAATAVAPPSTDSATGSAGPAAPDTGATGAPVTPQTPTLGTPPGANDPSVEMPGSAQHYLPGSDPIASSWQTIAQLPDLSPDTQRLLQLSGGG